MNVTLSSFRAMAAAAPRASRDIVLGRDDGMDVAKLGRFGRWSVLPHSKAMNRETMDAFRTALELTRGKNGTDAFDAVLGDRARNGKSLRAGDIRAVFEKAGRLEIDRLAERNSLARAMTDRRQGFIGVMIDEFSHGGRHAPYALGHALNLAVSRNLIGRENGQITPQDVDALYRCALEFETEDIADAIDEAIARHPKAGNYPPDRTAALRTNIRRRIVDRLFTLRNAHPDIEIGDILKNAAAALVDEVIAENEGTEAAARELAAEQAAQN